MLIINNIIPSNLFKWPTCNYHSCFFSPTDALLADLQNSVPGQPAQQQSRHHNYSPVNSNGVQNGASPGYGSVRPKPPQANSPTSVSNRIIIIILTGTTKVKIRRAMVWRHVWSPMSCWTLELYWSVSEFVRVTHFNRSSFCDAFVAVCECSPAIEFQGDDHHNRK